MFKGLSSLLFLYYTFFTLLLGLVTARNGPAHERVIRTLRAWSVDINEAFFLGGMPKAEVLKAFKPHIFFDDQKAHCDGAADSIPTARVPYVQQTDESST
jgi:5'-nucleotidase